MQTSQTISDSITEGIEYLRTDGVYVFKKQIESTNLPLLTQEITKISNHIMPTIKAMQRPLRTYSDIAERHLGRLDYRCGFIADIFKNIEEPITEIIKKTSPQINFKSYWGVVTSLGGSEPTNMHRDVYPILNTSTGMNLDLIDIHLPPYYFTVLIPLVNITLENGPTQFIKKSHLNPLAEEVSSRLLTPLLQPGDIVIFDGRTLHKGLANQTADERLVAYITYTANWYYDQTFTVNDYLFPELSIRGK